LEKKGSPNILSRKRDRKIFALAAVDLGNQHARIARKTPFSEHTTSYQQNSLFQAFLGSMYRSSGDEASSRNPISPLKIQALARSKRNFRQ
jgi:hypothetical protein